MATISVVNTKQSQLVLIGAYCLVLSFESLIIILFNTVCYFKNVQFNCNPIMGRSCCVPGCKSNYGVSDTSAFRFPKNEDMRRKWLNFIHRDKFIVTNNTLVCIKHFEERFIIREDVFSAGCGETVSVPRKKPNLNFPKMLTLVYFKINLLIIL